MSVRIYLRYLLPLLLVLTASTARSETFDAGVTAYENSEYTTALQHFEAALAHEETAGLRHNLALTHLHLDQPGEAAWHLERATLLAPFHSEYRFKRSTLRQQLGLMNDDAYWLTTAARALTLNGWLLLATLAFWLLLAVYLLPRVSASRVGLGVKATRVLCAGVLMIALPALIWQCIDRQTGLVVASEPSALRLAPANGAPQSGTVRPGERGRILDQHKAFYKIKTESETTGWIANEHFRKLRTPEK